MDIGIAGRLASLWVFAVALAVSTQPACANEEVTARNKEVVRNFYTTVLIGRDFDAAPRFLRPDYIHHNPQGPTGMKGFSDVFLPRFTQPLPYDAYGILLML